MLDKLFFYVLNNTYQNNTNHFYDPQSTYKYVNHEVKSDTE